jgi:hypothetical protein
MRVPLPGTVLAVFGCNCWTASDSGFALCANGPHEHNVEAFHVAIQGHVAMRTGGNKGTGNKASCLGVGHAIRSHVRFHICAAKSGIVPDTFS